MNLSWMLTLGISVALGCDAFAVGLALGTRNPDARQSFRLWFHFGLFQFLMTMGGWFLGRSLVRYIAAYDHWIAFGLLFFIAFRMMKESLTNEGEHGDARRDMTRGWSLVALSFATSFDALGVGFGLSLGVPNLWVGAVCIGIVAGVMTYAGILLGSRLSETFGKRVETFGALILFGIAFKLLSI